jgi:RHS repeat-associated protein
MKLSFSTKRVFSSIFMATTNWASVRLAGPLATVVMLLCVTQGVNAADPAQELATQIGKVPVFYEPLVPVGNAAPDLANSQALYSLIRDLPPGGFQQAYGKLEEFLLAQPDTAWAPAIRANLGCVYEDQGRFTKALEHWEAAWVAVGKESSGSAKRIADFTFARWTRLLSRLGQVNRLTELFEETKSRTSSGDVLLIQMIHKTRGDYLAMLNDTEVGFRCGAMALADLDFAVRGRQHDRREFQKLRAPVTGFSLSKLAEAGLQKGMNIAAAQWQGTKVPVVPSLVHWKVGHFSTITQKRGDYYGVQDASFSWTRWYTAEAIAEEASGFFLVPADKLPADWRRVTNEEVSSLFGRGYVDGAADAMDGCAAGTGGSNPVGGAGGGAGGNPSGQTATLMDAECHGGCGSGGGGAAGGGNATGGGGAPCCGEDGGEGGNADTDADPAMNAGATLMSGRGMAVWQVSEPFMNLWLYDEPLGYRPGLGYPIRLRLAYKQRDDRPISSFVFSFGPGWNCSWISYVVDDATAPVTFAPLGGSSPGYVDGTNGSSHRVLEQAPGPVYSTLHPDGARDYYAQQATVDGHLALFLTAQVDSHGHTNRFEYVTNNSVLQLARVVDADGRINTLSYTNLAFPSRITGVQDAFGRTAVLQYNSSGILTNISDPEGIKSSFLYDTRGWITNMVTPYGTNTFQHILNTEYPGDEFSGSTRFSSYIIRGLRVVDPLGGTNLYVLRQGSEMISTNNGDYWLDLIPSVFPSSVFPSGVPNYDDYYNDAMSYRNTFHWAPRTAGQIPTDLSILSPTDYRKARLRHWYHDYYAVSDIGPSLWMERSPSLDGEVDGQTTWYDYANKVQWYAAGPEAYPQSVARVLPDGTTWYRHFVRDGWGRPTTITETYSSKFGAVPQTRSWQYTYAPNQVDLAKVTGPLGETVAGYAYDLFHHVLRYTNAVGDVTHYTYDSMGRRTSTKTAAGLTTTNIYFASGTYTNWVQTRIDLEIARTNTFTYNTNLVETLTDERGVTTTYSYDKLGRLTRAADPRGAVTYAYTNLDLVRVVDRMGFTNSYGYDALRRLTAQTNALGAFTLYNYCPCGALESVRNAQGNYTYFYYDSAGRRTQVVYPDNYSVNYYYNILSQLTNTTDSAGYSVTNWYNNQGLLYASTNAYGPVKFLAFDAEDHVTSSLDANGVSVSTTYDALGRVLTRTYPDTGVERFGYSARGLIAYTNQLNATNFYVYDAARRKTFETNANWEITQFQYDPSGNLTNLLDGKNQSTKWKYDQYNRVTNKVDHLGNNLFAYGYDLNNRLTNRTSAAKGATVYRYDPAGNLTNVVYPVSPAITLQYDKLNQLTNMVDAIGTTRYSYDAAGQLLSEDGPWESDTVSYSYNNRLRTGLSLLAPNSTAWSQSYGYDAMRRMTNITSPAGAFGYEYTGVVSGNWPASLVRKIALPNAGMITNAYDSVGRMTYTILRNSSTYVGRHSYTYNLAGQRTQQIRYGISYVDYTYDKIGQLKTAKGTETGGALRLQEQFGYAYDAAGNLNFKTNNALIQTFNVNALNELTTITRSGTLTVAGTLGQTSPPVSVTVSGTGLTSGAATVHADSTWARAGATPADGQNSYTATATDGFGRQSSDTSSAFLPASRTCTYDLNGNLLSDGTRGFEYDDENQLVRITVTNSWKSEFAYDGKMRRRKRIECTWASGAWVTNAIVEYVYDGNLVIQERDGNNLPVVAYTRGKDLSGSLEGAGGIGGLLGRTDCGLLNQGSSAASAYYYSDGNGNVSALMDANQNVVARYLYDPFGNVLSQSGPLAEANLYRFSSKEAHPSSGLIYYVYRFYEPATQRWINREPLADAQAFRRSLHNESSLLLALRSHGIIEKTESANLYVFVHNVPHGFYDPLGLFGIPTCGYGCIAPPHWGEDGKECAIRIAREVGNHSPFGDKDPSSRWNHCVASCRISRECPGGRFTAWIAGDWVRDPWWEKGSSDPNDRAANKVGRRVSCRKETSCETMCDGELIARSFPTL